MAPAVYSARLLLRSPEEADRAAYVRMHEMSSAFLAPWSPKPEHPEDASGQFDSDLRRSARGVAEGVERRFLAFTPDGALVGCFNLFQVVRGAAQTAMASWRMNVDFANKGYATEAVGAMLNYAFDSEPPGLGLHRVQANIIPANAPSLRVAEKNGFRREGLAKRYLKIAGRWQDHILFAKLAEEHTLLPWRTPVT